MRIVSLLITLAFFGGQTCKKQTELSGIVKKYNYRGATVIDTVFVELEQQDDTILYKEKYVKYGTLVINKIHKKDRNILRTIEGISYLVNTKDFKIFDKNYRIYKFLYDEINSSDEEFVYFFCEKYGIILTRWLHEGLGTSLEYDKTSTELVKQILADTTGFYMAPPPPPPPPPPPQPLLDKKE